MSVIKIAMAARCEAAGRPNNEDNFHLHDNLSGNQWGFMTDKEVTLNEKGALMVVCDGMGGMNAGDTASRLAVEAIKEWFATDRLTPTIFASHETVMSYIEQAIIGADSKIKEAEKDNNALEGMGSTIVLAWVIGDYIYIGWCGDSRAYRYNPATGLEQLSHDHSYVQDLVDSGKLSKELAFDHPNNNIVTRSLGDIRQVAEPSVKCFPNGNGDVILLCSDGLSGVLRDPEIANIIQNNSQTMESCRNALWTESEKAGWTDNVTIALCQIISGVEQPKSDFELPATGINPAKTETEVIEKIMNGNRTEPVKKKNNRLLLIIILLLLLGAAFEAGHYIVKKRIWNPLDMIEQVMPGKK
ncbi:MAG: protein phosphatase 2C domain-containing protein [Tannerella sp.]|jgi:serine/threonine protein phosphatase PrpC|nr:protein phosphatase 2C domain-containing protein [Tannerella sp.]